ncbi:unnamed protein product, partial [Ectocarpus sp. 8 AP-2014]
GKHKKRSKGDAGGGGSPVDSSGGSGLAVGAGGAGSPAAAASAANLSLRPGAGDPATAPATAPATTPATAPATAPVERRGTAADRAVTGPDRGDSTIAAPNACGLSSGATQAAAAA